MENMTLGDGLELSTNRNLIHCSANVFRMVSQAQDSIAQGTRHADWRGVLLAALEFDQAAERGLASNNQAKGVALTVAVLLIGIFVHIT